jgi:CubicO group peptidase (beta-lactamase class C family)
MKFIQIQKRIKMKRLVAVIALLAAFSVCLSAQTIGDKTANRVKDNLSGDVDKYLQNLTESGFSGSVLIAIGDEILLHKGYGWIDKKRTVPISIDTEFWVASVTKQFTAAAVLKLEEKGKINVQDSITKYFKNVPADKAGVTIHQLLTHTSGIGQNYAADGIVNREDAVKSILKAALKNPPGERFNYSNDNYTLLAAIIESASGQTYESFLSQNLFQKTGMSQTGFWGETREKSNRKIAPFAGEISANNKKANWGFRGGVGISSTTGDLYKWHRALTGDRVLSKASREKFFKPYVTVGKIGDYTYGWFVSKTTDGRDALWTRGNEDFGHNAIIKSYADGFSTVVVSNAGELNGVPVSRSVSAELEKIIYGK